VDYYSDSSSGDGPSYTSVAALQDLALLLLPPRAARSGGRAIVAPAAGGSRSLLVAAADAAADGGAGGGSTAPVAANSSRGASSSSSSSSKQRSARLELDPPFTPLLGRYTALLPPRAHGALLLASSRAGDAIIVDASGCEGVDSGRYAHAGGQGQGHVGVCYIYVR
jgi:hypothetical protein